MKTIRVFAVLSALAAVACVSSMEQQSPARRDDAAQAAHASIAALHAAIPANQASAEVFEYTTVIAEPEPQKTVAAGDADGKFFDYN